MITISIITILKCNNFIYFKNLYENILDQTYSEYIIEWIILDGSNKYKYMKQNKSNINIFINNLNNNFDIKYIDFEKTNNYIKLRNIGNNKVKGNYIIYMDIYEYHYINRLELGINKLIDNNDYKIVGNKTNLFYKNNKIYKINNELLYLNSLIYKKDFIKNNYYNDNYYYFLNNNNILNFNEFLTININIDIDINNSELTNINNLPDKYKYINKINDTTNDNDNDIIYYIGKGLKFDPYIYNVNYEIVKEFKNLKTNISNAIELIIKLAESLKNEEIYEIENDVTVYGEFKLEMTYNNVKYKNWYNFKSYNNKNTIIIWDIIGISSFIYYNISSNIIIINFITLNFKLLNNLNQFLLFNLFDQVKYFIFKCDNQCNLFKLFTNNKYENEKYIIIPNVYIFKEEIEFKQKSEIIKNNNRYCYLGNNINDLLILDHTWTEFIKQNENNELHIYINDINNINLINNNNIYIHKINTKEEIIDEIVKSKYIFLNIYDTLDIYNHYICTNLKCTPIILKDKKKIDINLINYETYNYKNIIFPIITLYNYNLFLSYLYKYKKINNIKWALPTNNKLSLVIIEPRRHILLSNILYNFAYYYNNTNTSLFIFHSDTNKNYINNIIDTWENVQLIPICYSNININDYNNILKSSNFWNNFKSEYVLIFQTDTMIFKEIPNEFYNYDFIGPTNIIGNDALGCNGGLSLRKTEIMRYICINYPNTNDVNEDIYYNFYLNINKNKFPTYIESSKFGIESLVIDNNIDICGIHCCWRHLNNKILNNIFKNNVKI